tara:strand:- start:85 stop:333 length:249 start_codon:yes stop_codon:yes gene_type:complete
MVKTLVILILLFNGDVFYQQINFTPSINLMECLALGDAYREAMATHSWGDPLGPPGFGIDHSRNGWYLNDGRGTIQGHFCSN